MSYPFVGYNQSGSGRGGGMPMPMPQAYPSSSAATPYPSNTASTYSNTYPTSTTSSYQSSSSSSSEVDQWVEQVTSNLSSLLKNASAEELSQLCDNEEKLTELVQDSEQMKSFERKRAELIEFNRDQALKNMAYEPELQVLKENLVSLMEQQNELKVKYSSLQERLSGSVSLDTTLAVLQAATSEKETESEQLSQDFINGEKPLDEFLQQFIQDRQIYQLRKIKSDKMVYLLRNGQSSTANSNRPVPMPRPSGNTGVGYSYQPGGGYGGYQH